MEVNKDITSNQHFKKTPEKYKTYMILCYHNMPTSNIQVNLKENMNIYIYTYMYMDKKLNYFLHCP